MAIYMINLLLIILYNFLIKDKKKFTILVSIQLFLILALRSTSLGVDLLNYNSGFYYIKSLSFFNMLSKLHFFNSADLIYPFFYESGYVFFNWIISHLGLSFHGFLIVCAFINIVSFSYFIYNYSEYPWLSFIILCTFGTYTYFFGIIRQSLALSIFLWSLHFAINNKKAKSFLLFICAFLNHRAVLILCPIYLFINKKVINKKSVFIALMCSFLFLAISNFLYSKVIYYIMALFGKGYSSHGLQINNLIILLYLIAFILVAFLNFKKVDNQIIIISIWALIISIYFEIFGMYNDNFARSIQLYNAFLIISIPYTIKQYSSQKITPIITCLTVLSLTTFFIYSLNNSVIVPYKIEDKNIILENCYYK